MKLFTTLFLIITAGVLSACRAPAPEPQAAVRFAVDSTACQEILGLLKEMKSGCSQADAAARLDGILDSKPYTVMFAHYNRDWRPNHLPPEVFKRMVLSLEYPNLYHPGENQRADRMLTFWTKYYTDLTKYERKLQQIRETDLNGMIAEAIAFAQSWLPPEMIVPEFYFTIHPNGGSPGFIIGEAQGYDFFQLPEDISQLYGMIAHEMHHAGLDIPRREFARDSDAVAFSILEMFVGEGTANKFISNVPGGNAPAIRENETMDYFDQEILRAWMDEWNRLTGIEDELFHKLADTFDRAYAGDMTEEELNREIRDFWLKGFVQPLYFVGSELFGAIYYGFGREACFDAMRDPRLIFDLYNRSLQRRPERLGKCPAIPASTAENARLLGQKSAP